MEDNIYLPKTSRIPFQTATWIPLLNTNWFIPKQQPESLWNLDRFLPKQQLSMLFQKNPDWSLLQQPQNALSKTRTDHPYSSPKILFQKPELITLIAAPKCSLKNPDWSPLQQPQNVPSKTRTDHPYSSPKMLFQKRRLITLTAAPKCSFKTQTDSPYNSPKMLFQKPELITLTTALKCSFKTRIDSSNSHIWQPHFFSKTWTGFLQTAA